MYDRVQEGDMKWLLTDSFIWENNQFWWNMNWTMKNYNLIAQCFLYFQDVFKVNTETLIIILGKEEKSLQTTRFPHAPILGFTCLYSQEGKKMLTTGKQREQRGVARESGAHLLRVWHFGYRKRRRGLEVHDPCSWCISHAFTHRHWLKACSLLGRS